MNKLRYLCFLLSLFYVGSLFSQVSKEEIFKIDDKIFYTSDFEYAYKKELENNPEKNTSVSDFFDAYVLLKTKVLEAESLNLQKKAEFINEYGKYSTELIESFLEDSIPVKTFARELFDRSQKNYKVSLIFIPYQDAKVFSKDTLDAYNKISKIYTEVKKSKEDVFIQKALEYPAQGSRPLIHVWMTALMTPAPLEDVIYSTPIGAISKPVRTDGGYYIARVEDERPDRGERRISQIVLNFPENATEQQKDSVRSMTLRVMSDLEEGKPFEALAMYASSDPKSLETRGDMGWFSVASLLPHEIDSIFFSIDTVSLGRSYLDPIESDVAVYIYSLTGKKENTPWEQVKSKYLDLAAKNRRNEIKGLKLERLKQQYSTSINKKTYHKMLDIANVYHVSDSTFFLKLIPIKESVLLDVEGTNYTVSDFISFVEGTAFATSSLSTDIVDEKINEFLSNRLEYVNNIIQKKFNPELRYRLQNYGDGLLTFSLMDKEVWSRSLTDKENLENLFHENRAKYVWDSSKFKGYVIHLRNKEAYDKAISLMKNIKEGDDYPLLLLKELNTTGSKQVLIEKGVWGKGENDFVDNYMNGAQVRAAVTDFPFFVVYGEVLDQPQSYEDIKGAVDVDYQTILEKNLVDRIEQKYKVTKNSDVLQRLEQKYSR